MTRGLLRGLSTEDAIIVACIRDCSYVRIEDENLKGCISEPAHPVLTYLA